MRYAASIRQRFMDGYELDFPVKLQGVGFVTKDNALTTQPSDSPWIDFHINTGGTVNGAIGNPRMSLKNQAFSVVVALHLPITTAGSGTVYIENDIDAVLRHVDTFMLFSKYSPEPATVIFSDRATPIIDSNPEPVAGDNWHVFFRTYNYEYRYKANIPAP